MSGLRWTYKDCRQLHAKRAKALKIWRIGCGALAAIVLAIVAMAVLS